MYILFSGTYTFSGQLAVGVATDCYEHRLYWTDAADGMIGKANLDGTESETIISGRNWSSRCLLFHYYYFGVK